MKKLLNCIVAFLTIFTAFGAGLWHTDKNYLMMSICLIGAVSWYILSHANIVKIRIFLKGNK